MPDRDDETATPDPDEGDREPMELAALIAEIDQGVGMAPMAAAREEKFRGLAEDPDLRGGRCIRFFLEETEIGAPLSSVLEVGRLPDITPLPNVPPWISGVCNIRGEIVSVVDLKSYLGWPPSGRERDNRLIVVHNGELKTGFRVDRVAGVLSLDGAGVVVRPGPFTDEPEPELGFYARGVVDLDEHSLYILDVEKLLTSSRVTDPASREEEIREAIPGSEGEKSRTGAPPEARGGPRTPGPPAELLENFYVEAEDHLEDLGRVLGAVEAGVAAPETISPDRREEIRRVRRSVHTLKGAASTVKLMEVSKWAHEVEDLLDWLYEEAEEITPGMVAVLVDSADLLERLVANPGKADVSRADALGARIRGFIGEEAKGVAPRGESQGPEIDMSDILASMDDDDEAADFPGAPFGGGMKAIDAAPAPVHECIDERRDDRRRKERREAPRVDGPARSARTLRVDMDRLEGLVNLAGELTIALGACDRKMALFTRVMREYDLSRDRLRNLGREMEARYEVKAIRGVVDGEGPPLSGDGAGCGAGCGPGGDAGSGEFDPLEPDRCSEFNLLIGMLDEFAEDMGSLNTRLTDIHGDMDGCFNRQRILLGELQGEMMRVRMSPMAGIVNKLRQTLREAARALGKEIRLDVEGEHIELDREVWEKISDPLMHLVRNAADHGVESPDRRRALGKPPMGVVKLAAAREGARVVIRVSDDGGGVDLDAIRRKVREEGISDRAEALSEDELTAMIFRPGFSTRGAVSETSGRGVGLDVVTEKIKNLKGSVKAASREGRGTVFTIRIPLTMAVVNALFLTAGGREFAMGMNEISEIRRVRRDEIGAGPGEIIRVGGETPRLLSLAKALNLRESDAGGPGASEHPIVLVVKAGGRRIALEIDAIQGRGEIVVKSLGSHLHHVKGVSGAAVMGDGGVVPILDMEDLFHCRL